MCLIRIKKDLSPTHRGEICSRYHPNSSPAMREPLTILYRGSAVPLLTGSSEVARYAPVAGLPPSPALYRPPAQLGSVMGFLNSTTFYQDFSPLSIPNFIIQGTDSHYLTSWICSVSSADKYSSSASSSAFCSKALTYNALLGSFNKSMASETPAHSLAYIFQYSSFSMSSFLHSVSIIYLYKYILNQAYCQEVYYQIKYKA